MGGIRRSAISAVIGLIVMTIATGRGWGAVLCLGVRHSRLDARCFSLPRFGKPLSG